MLITSLDKMEQIVNDNKSLTWDGWTVVNYTKSPTAWTKTSGAFVNNSWHTATRYEPTAAGWDLPNRFVSNNAQE
jgi:hypothetical protein